MNPDLITSHNCWCWEHSGIARPPGLSCTVNGPEDNYKGVMCDVLEVHYGKAQSTNLR